MPGRPPPILDMPPIFPRTLLGCARLRLAIARYRHKLARERLNDARRAEFTANLRVVNAAKRFDAVHTRLEGM